MVQPSAKKPHANLARVRDRLRVGVGALAGVRMVWGAAGANQWAKSSQKSRMSTTRTTLPPDMSLV